jgi:hypothetical protein
MMTCEVPTVSRIVLRAVTSAFVLAQSASFAQAQTPDQPPAQPFVARATVNVANDSAAPQTVAGTNVMPFELMPHQQARLDMSVVPPPAPAAPGGAVPVRFEYSVGQAAGPQCHGTIDMSLKIQGTTADRYEVTDCVAHSLGTNGAHCHIAVEAQNAACQGGLAFAAR